jgi:hypothetical protein
MNVNQCASPRYPFFNRRLVVVVVKREPKRIQVEQW